MGKTRVTSGKALMVERGVMNYALDPMEPVKADYTFVSHAHMDHAGTPHPKSKTLASRETALLARARGVEIGEPAQPPEGVRLLDSGHILGARALWIEDEFLYTGDAAGRDRAFLGRCKTRRARVLVTETTFGDPRFVFPPLDQTVKQVNEMIARSFDRGRPVVLMGYALGKSQILSYLFSAWHPLLLHKSVAGMNEVHRRCGVSLREATTVEPSLEGLPPGPWVMVAPLLGARNRLAARLRKEHGAVLAAFSGWAAAPGYARSLGADYAFPLSDHCDYEELMQLVEDVGPELVYTTHGFTDGFAAALKREGFDAKPLGGYQASISDF